MDPTVKRFNATPLEYLSQEQMRDIHSAALEILEDCGTVIHHEKAVALLHKAGAYVKDDRQVFIPGGLVEWAGSLFFVSAINTLSSAILLCIFSSFS